MGRVDRFGIVAALAIGTMVAPAVAGDVTVGRFCSELAKAKQLVSGDSASAEASLRGAGFNLPRLKLDKSLTEGDMVSISNAIGVAVKTESPSKPVSESLITTYLSVFGNQLGARGGTIGDPFRVYSDHEKPKKSKSTREP